ncbi:MAG: hypothetical protein EOO50_02675 [Flavobacterium sp.]|uniref:hypothetical protein n=1 Tax=Flavobacterium sp. TaxID=239 RepID=UPI001224F1D4|nr:hypothetical protein [Flavobacterium sp.]RZJ68343.1 MAG: hypothetical protein EOO50_02675 [Flavobacterium sp.]
MTKIALLLYCLILTTDVSFGCLNGETKMLKNGYYIYEDRDDDIPRGHIFYVDNFLKLLRDV